MSEMGHLRLHVAATEADEALLKKVKELERRVSALEAATGLTRRA